MGPDALLATVDITAFTRERRLISFKNKALDEMKGNEIL